MAEVTEIIADIRAGKESRADELLPLVYEELRRLAQDRMRNEKSGNTLQATALVHEAYLRLIGTKQDATSEWNGRGHFFAAAAEAMRRILIENARQRTSKRRGGDYQRVELNGAISPDIQDPARLLELNELIDQHAVDNPVNAELVKLILFTGLSVEDSASALGISTATAYRKWKYSRAVLRMQLS